MYDVLPVTVDLYIFLLVFVIMFTFVHVYTYSLWSAVPIADGGLYKFPLRSSISYGWSVALRPQKP